MNNCEHDVEQYSKFFFLLLAISNENKIILSFKLDIVDQTTINK